MKTKWFYRSRSGIFVIRKQGDRFHLFFNDDCIGSYQHPWQASEDVAMGALPSLIDGNGNGICDTSGLGVPADLGEWNSE